MVSKSSFHYLETPKHFPSKPSFGELTPKIELFFKNKIQKMKINDFVLASPPNSNKSLHAAALASESSSISSSSSTNEAEQNIPDQVNTATDYVQSSGSLQHYLFLSNPICNIQLNNIPDNFGGVSASFTTEDNRLSFNETNREVAIFNSKKFMLIPLVRGETIAKR